MIASAETPPRSPARQADIDCRPHVATRTSGARRRHPLPARSRQLARTLGRACEPPLATKSTTLETAVCSTAIDERNNDNDVSDLEPEDKGERNRREDVRAKLFREHRRLPSREPELDVRRRPPPRHRRVDRDEEPSRDTRRCQHQPRHDRTDKEDASQATQATQATRRRRPPPTYREEEVYAREEPDRGEDPVASQDLPDQQPPCQQRTKATPPRRSGQTRQPPQWYTPPPSNNSSYA